MTDTTKILVSYHGREGRDIARVFSEHLDRHDEIKAICSDSADAVKSGKHAADNLNGARWFFFVATKQSCKSPEALAEIQTVVARRRVNIVSLLDKGVKEEDLPAPLQNKECVRLQGGPEHIYQAITSFVKTKEEANNKQAAKIREEKKPAEIAAQQQKQKNELAVLGFVAGLIVGALFTTSNKK